MNKYLQGNGTLKNKLGIRDAKKLDEKEAALAALRIDELGKKPIQGNYDLEHLKEIHKYIFKDVYEWAGEIRSEDISKGSTTFCLKDNIESFGASTMKDIKKDVAAFKSAPTAFKEVAPDKLAHHLGELNALHPFREGNGRAQKVMVGQMAKEGLGLDINWQKMDKKSFIEGSAQSFTSKPTILSNLIRSNLESAKVNKVQSQKQVFKK